MALPTNLESLESAIQASDVGQGRKAQDTTYWASWNEANANLQSKGFDDNEKLYFCNYVGWSSVIHDDILDEMCVQMYKMYSSETIYDEHAKFSQTTESLVYYNCAKYATDKAKEYENYAEQSKKKKDKEYYQDLAKKYQDDANVYNKIYNTWKTYYSGYAKYQKTWENDLKNAQTTFKKPIDESGKECDETKQDGIVYPDTSINIEVPNQEKNEEASAQSSVEQTLIMHAAWDPRLHRADYFLFTDENSNNHIRIPFSSITASTAFGDQAWKLEKLAASKIIPAAVDRSNNKELAKENIGFMKTYYDALYQGASKTDETTNNSDKQNKINDIYSKLRYDDKLIMQDPKVYEHDGEFWGSQSIANPYTLTRLAGGIDGDGTENYMYDIRDKRRFYGFSTDNDILSVSNPSVTQLIKYGNDDKWGRTPYSFQDFVYCKYFGLIPNNRLITFRRYHAPCLDNLQFENMYGEHEKMTTDSSGNKRIEKVYEESKENPGKTFSPIASVVTWFGGDTGNTLSGLINFSTGMKWGEVQSKIHEVSGDEGESKQSVIDRMLGNGGEYDTLLPDAEIGGLVNSILDSGSTVSAKLTSYGKFSLAMNGSIGIDQTAFDKLAGVNIDPYDSTLANRIKGPVNRIDTVKKRDAGIDFRQTLNITCAYSAKSIGGINPKAALLDILGNCLEMASPHAVFWGGGYRFNIKPSIYPFHDGGWRDSFMAKLYDGNVLGDNGAVATVLSGIKSVGTDKDGNFSMDSIKSALGGAAGCLLSMVGSAIQSVADMFGGSDLLGGLAEGLNENGADLQGIDASNAKRTAQEKINNYFSNMSQLWHNKMAAETMQPQINGMGSLLIGAPVGEWHLTIGNPLNPIAVIGNLICTKMEVKWNDELGPDDFPTGFSVTYSIEHGMPRDSDAIQSMFNRGMGKIYVLPDWMSTSSDGITAVDEYTLDNGSGDTGAMQYKNPQPLLAKARAISATGGGGGAVYQTRVNAPGVKNINEGNYNTQLVTKFNPINSSPQSVMQARLNVSKTNGGTYSQVKSLAITRKLTGE